MTHRVIGRSIPRPDAVGKVTGRACYTSDLVLPGMVHTRLVRSSVPCGRLVHLETEAARRVPGVLAVVTGGEISRLPGVDPYYGPAFKDQPVLAIDEVRYEGEPVAAVVAETETAAGEAASLVQDGYDERVGVFTLDDALAPDAPLVHREMRRAGTFRDLAALNPLPGTNVCHHFHYELGEGAAGFAGAARIFEQTYTFPMVAHVSLESHAVVAVPDTDGVTLYTACQHPFPVRREVAEMLGVPQHAVRLIVPYVGGAFGNKSYTKLEPLTAILARLVGRPVRLALSLPEQFVTGRRSAARCRVRTGVAGDGTIAAQQWQIDYQLGAYADVGPRIAQKSAYTAAGPYRIPHLVVDARAVYTHTPPAIAFRGYGVPQLAWAGESHLDTIARELGEDPVAYRARHLLSRGDNFRPGDLPVDADLPNDLRRTAAAIAWQTPVPHERGRRDHMTRLRGRGLALAIKAPLAPSRSDAAARLHSDGTVSVACGTVEIGQGARGVMAQIAAEELGVDLSAVRVQEPDTRAVPFDQGTSASRSTAIMGLAVQRAARELKRRLLEAASSAAGGAEARWEDGRLAAGGRQWTTRDVWTLVGAPAGEIAASGEAGSGPGDAMLGGAVPFWEMAFGAVEIAVDVETGELLIVRAVSLADVGKALNPVQCEGQDEGAVLMGVGHTLFERLVYEDGQLLTPGLIDYRVPGFSDLPAELQTILVENGDGPGPFGAKGMGESGIIPVAPAVANALHQASGVRLTDLPLTPERVWRALRTRASERAAVG